MMHGVGSWWRAIFPLLAAGLVGAATRLSCALDTGEIPLPNEMRFIAPIISALVAGTIGQIYTIKDQEARFYRGAFEKAASQAKDASTTAIALATTPDSKL